MRLEKTENKLKLRNAERSDLELTYRIGCNSIKPCVIKIWGWDESFQREMHRQKFDASETKIIEYGGKEVGLLIVKEFKDEIYLQSILIEKKFQNVGIGKIIMQGIITRANYLNRPIRLQVFKINVNAQRFYKRLGFMKISEMENHIGMKRMPTTTEMNN
ncbi:MAG: hypothetical protein CL868_06450 [Cytophagaceae bacterium]|nr:hypothetical protein [Cytophagaceae bacterium]|tara:strand:- start:332 stop:811 length:480 start_codon:yes stop_codon:yes gene_type:complete